MPEEFVMENWIFLGMSPAIFASYQKLYRKMTAKNEFARPDSPQIKCFKACFLMCIFILISSASFCEYADFSNWHFPSPPQQSIAWNPGATNLSNEVILAMRQLFELGLADPRGCEYKTVQVETGSVWAHCPIMITTRGWVLPESPNSKCSEKWVICWNGLLYPVASMGPSIDLAADVEEMLQKSIDLPEDRRDISVTGNMNTGVTTRYRDFRCHSIPEKYAIDYHFLTPLKAFLVYRAGHESLAERMWREYYRSCDNVDEYPLLPVIMEWVWYQWDRAVCAHMRADDRIALLTARKLLPTLKVDESGWKDCRLPNWRFGGGLDCFSNPRFLTFATGCSMLLIDHERRLWEKTMKNFWHADLWKKISQSLNLPLGETEHSEVKTLIKNLENAQICQSGQPGWLEFDQAETVRKLSEIGDDAVEPLLQSLETDDRLSRSVSFGRDFHFDRSFLPVSSLIDYILSRILRTNHKFQKGSTKPTRKEYVAAIRSYWQKFRNCSVPERSFIILQDDHASIGQWVESANVLTKSVDQELVPKGFGWQTVYQPKPGQLPPMTGEKFRTGVTPTLTELLEKRSQQLATIIQNGAENRYSAEEAYPTILYDRCKWEPEKVSQILDEYASTTKNTREAWEPNSDFCRKLNYIFEISKLAWRAGYEDGIIWTVSYISSLKFHPELAETITEFFSSCVKSNIAEKFLRESIETGNNQWSEYFRADICRDLSVWSNYSRLMVGLFSPFFRYWRSLFSISKIAGHIKPQFLPRTFYRAEVSIGENLIYVKRYQGDDIFWPKEDTTVEFSIGDLLCQLVCELTYTAKFRVFWPQPVKEFARKRCFDIWFWE